MVEYKNLFSSFLRENQIKINEPMSRHTTFGIGGPADCFVMPETLEELQKIVKKVNEESIPLFVLGGGANLLVRDKGIRGVVVHMGRMQKMECDGSHLHAFAGVSTAAVAKRAMEHGLSGMEFAAGIPGSIGGAAYMNAGAYDGEMAEVVESVISCDSKGNIVLHSGKELDYGYRHSLFMQNKEIIIEVVMNLSPGCIEQIKMKMDDFNDRRRTKQPLEKKSAGSTFKRPAGHFVGQMIEELGLKGFSVGDAKVSTKHAGFLINDGKASCSDMIALIHEVQKRVEEKYKVKLKTEVQIIGEE